MTYPNNTRWCPWTGQPCWGEKPCPPEKLDANYDDVNCQSVAKSKEAAE